MTDRAFLRVGWCPGALRPMESGDGFIVRVKPRAGVLTFDHAEVMGRLSLRYGNGLIDLTGRANLQIRGATAASLPPLTQALQDLGLLDAGPEAEAIRNIVASPLAGLDSRAACDIRPLVAAIEDRFAGDRTLHALPPKWSLVIDDGGPLSLAAVPADLRFEAVSDGTMLVGLAEDPHRGWCRPEQVADVAVAFARLALEGAQPRRMQALVQACGARALFATVGLPLVDTRPSPRAAIGTADLVGWHIGRSPAYVGLAPPFASLDAHDLIQLAEVARASQAGDLRLTPWRVMLVTDLVPKAVAAFARAMEETALVIDPADPGLAITACTGRPACHRGTMPTRADASVVSKLLPRELLGRGVLLHISGCEKGCAQGAATPWTLVGRDIGYELVHGGGVGGMAVARGLSIGEAATWISRDPDTRVH